MCDYDICMDCGADAIGPGGVADVLAFHFHHFRNAFDEFCFLREAELAVGFDTMTSEQPFVIHPEIFQTAPRLDLREASALCQPYLHWWQQSSCGSMGSSALASALTAVCALWLTELAMRGWRHPLLLLFSLAAVVQPLVDLVRVGTLLRSCQSAAGLKDGKFDGLSTMGAGDSDSMGHLAGSAVGALAYVAVLRRGGRVKPLYPLVPRVECARG